MAIGSDYIDLFICIRLLCLQVNHLYIYKIKKIYMQ